MKKFHLAWFGNASPSGWRKPSGQLFDWRQADIYLEIARLCERAKFDMVLSPTRWPFQPCWVARGIGRWLMAIS